MVQPPASTRPRPPPRPAVQSRTTQGERKVGILLAIGIFVFPYLFAWFTLRKGHSTLSRVLAFVWMIVIVGAAISRGKEESRLVSPEKGAELAAFTTGFKSGVVKSCKKQGQSEQYCTCFSEELARILSLAEIKEIGDRAYQPATLPFSIRDKLQAAAKRCGK